MIGVNIIRFLIILLLIFSVSQAASEDAKPSRVTCTGIWAAAAESPYIGQKYRPINVLSPDGTLSINATKEDLTLVKDEKCISRLEISINPPLMEVLWSPDSRHFIVNVSDGGLVGTWETKWFDLNRDDQPVLRDIGNRVRSVSEKLLQCYPMEVANIGGSAWLNESKELLLIIEVPPHSSCRNMGEILGLRISVSSGEIIEQLSEDALRQKWGHVMGCRFIRSGKSPSK